MKNKPSRHKETNTFKFKRFSERISEINIDIFHRVVHRNEENSDDAESLETNFYRTLCKWNVLNLTTEYVNFRKEVKHVVTLPQLLNNKDEVIASLTKYLKMKNVTFLQPILDMVVAIAKDLQIEFYQYFPHFLDLMINLLDIKDSEIIDYTFTTLAYLFKFLWRYFIKNMSTIFKLLLPLLVDSKPPYINNFAAESFAFVARKVRDREAFIQFIFQTIGQIPDGIHGCGRLLFEVISGTPGQFHSCTEQMLNLYLDTLTNETIDYKLAYNILHQVFMCITTEINPKYCQIFWEIIIKKFDDILTNDSTKISSNGLQSLLKLICLIVDHKHGIMLQNPTALIARINKLILIHKDNQDNEISNEIIDLSVSILFAKNIILNQELFSELIFKLLTFSNKQLIIYTVKKLINHTSFETVILPTALQTSILKEEFSDHHLELFAEIVTSRVPCFGGKEYNQWRKLDLNLRTFPSKSRELLREKFDNWENINNNENCINEDFLKVVIILPHITTYNDELIDNLKYVFISIYEKLLNDNSEITCQLSVNKIQQRSYAFLLLIHSIIRVMDDSAIQQFFENTKIDLLTLMEKYPNDIVIFTILDTFYTHASKSLYKKEYINIDHFDRLNGVLVKQLGSSFTQIRSTVCHLYSLFEEVKEIFIDDINVGEITENNIIKLLYTTENVEISVHTYRDRLMYLQSLTFGTRATMRIKPKYYEIPLKFLFGNLYINFSLLWPHVNKAIASYADEKCPQFWPILMNELTQDNRNVFNNLHCLQLQFRSDIFQNILKQFSLNDDKPDFDNYKILIWKCLCEFPGYCEIRNRDLTGLFINFVESNFFMFNTEISKRFSIKKQNEQKDNSFSLNKTLEENDGNQEMNYDDNEQNQPDEVIKEIVETSEFVSSKNVNIKSTSKPRSSTFKLLLAQLKIMSLMQNPKMLYREQELFKIYMDLLISKNVELQKCALNCIFAYKQKNLLPYKDHLYGLMDEKNLRNELARFKIIHDEGTGDVIIAEHREILMPILLRIIYAKLITRGTGRAAGAVGGLARRKIILRFLMGITTEELVMFAKMVFKPFERYHISLSPDDQIDDLTMLTANIAETHDLSNVIVPKRLRSAINLLDCIIEEFGAKTMNSLLPRLLAILICILADIKCILEKSDQILSGFLSIIKELRINCLGIATKFFVHFDTYPWSPSDLDAFFNVAIFPSLEKLPFEGIHSPTALLKLISAWSKNSRYFCLLVKHKDDDKNVTCLSYVIKLLLNEKTHNSVTVTILEMIEKLLTLADFGTTSEETMEIDSVTAEIQPLTPRNILDVDLNAVSSGSSLNYGSTILLPHITDILNFIQRNLKKHRMNISKIESSILSRMTDLYLEPETASVLLSLLLPILVKKVSTGISENVIMDILITIKNLMGTVINPKNHVRDVLPLLYYVSSPSARKILLMLLETVFQHITDSTIGIKNANILTNLNAMNEKWLEQPDFEKRIDAFSEINVILSSEIDIYSKLSLEFGVAIMYNLYYFLQHETDLSLRDSSGECLNTLGPKLVNMYKDDVGNRKYLVEDTILNLVRIGIRGKNDLVKTRSISLLGIMSVECFESHPIFRDLHLLTNKLDPEVDFFENLQHLQLHRKTRALLKFCTIAKTLKTSIHTKTLTQFIFPVASSFLCNDTFVGKNSIVDAAIETVGIICRLLPWHQYALILKYYLCKLRNQGQYRKQIIRIIVAVLDGFHYDLSKLKVLNDNIKINDTATIELKESNMCQDNLINSSNVAIQESEKVNLEMQNKCDDEKGDESKNGNNVKEFENINNIDTEESAELLDEELAQESRTEEAMIDCDNIDPNTENVDEFIIDKQTNLSHSAAKRLVSDITNIFLPQLNRTILSRTQHEMSHKVNRNRTGIDKEEDELMRVPIALALVKLLQKLPENIVERNLPGIFMKLCTFLKSRLDSVRRVTREIIQKIMVTLGPDYLHYLLREMNSLLTKGFQIHVLAFTIHAVLTSLKPLLKSDHMNNNLQSILQVCKVDLFGCSADEKEVVAITRSVAEAKSTKSFDIYHILGQFITESCLLDLIQPLNEILNQSRNNKITVKISECLRRIVLGLADNTFINSDKMLIFLYGIVSKSIPCLNVNKTTDKKTKNLKFSIEKSDCFIIPEEPKSMTGIKAFAKVTSFTNDHVMLEFGLKLLHILLKREKITEPEFQSYLNPFVPILTDCLECQHVKLSTLALQCFNWLLKINLEAITVNIKDICSLIFKILHKYAAAGLGKGDNFNLVMAAFKTMSIVIRHLKSFEMSYDEIKVLVLYAEQDLYDADKRATAFNLLRAIISRQLNVFQIQRVMKNVAILSITSESDSVRQQSRAVFYQYLMNYPLENKLNKHLSFYLAQMSYEMQSGRHSALDMMHSIITGFPLKILIEQSELFFVTIGARLINDDDPNCRKYAAQCIKQIILRITYNQRYKLFDIIVIWFKDTNIFHRRLAAQLCGIFVTTEKDDFATRLDLILPLIIQELQNDCDSEGKSDENHKNSVKRQESQKVRKRKKSRDGEERDGEAKTEEIAIKTMEEANDHHLFQLLQLTLKISSSCPAFLKLEKYINCVKTIAEYSQKFLAHPHLWVRLAAAQQIGFVLATINEDKLSQCVKKLIDSKDDCEEKLEGYVYSNPLQTLKSLSLDLISQLQPQIHLEEFLNQVIKNLVFIARVIKALPSDKTKQVNGEEHDLSISIFWLMKKLRRCVNIEVVQSFKSTLIRTAVFKWIAGVITTIPIEPYLKPILFQMMSPLVREMVTTEESNAQLRQLAKDVMKILKKKLGDEEYMRLLLKVQQKIDIRKTERKKIQKQKFVVDPELAAKKKIIKQQRNKEARKRKKSIVHGKKFGVKRRKFEVDLDI